MTPSITILYSECHCAECHFDKGRDLFSVMLNVIMLSDVMLNVIMLSDVMLNVFMPSVIILNVVAPKNHAVQFKIIIIFDQWRNRGKRIYFFL